MPEYMNGTSNKLLYLNKNNFFIKTNLKFNCDIITENVRHYRNVIFPPKIYTNVTKKSKTTNEIYLTTLNIFISQSNICPKYPDSTMNESCIFLFYFNYKKFTFFKIDNLTVNSKGAELYSESVWGALRGLETFSQLTYFTDDNKVFFPKYKISIIF